MEWSEEVVVEDGADAQEQVSVDAAFGEDAVHGLAVATEFGGEPGHRALLTLELMLDGLSDVEHKQLIVPPASRSNHHYSSEQISVRQFTCLPTRGIAKHPAKDRQSSPHAMPYNCHPAYGGMIV